MTYVPHLQQEMNLSRDRKTTQNWKRLNVEDGVLVSEPGSDPYGARVDAKMSDSTVIWVVTASGYRYAFDHREEVEIRLVTAE
jgi:hypothetical protein